MSLDELIAGCFENVKDAAFVDYLIKCGTPKDDAKKMEGTHWHSRVEQVKPGRWVGVTKCEEMPCMNMVDTYVEGQPKDIDHPLFGGKAKITFARDGKDGFKCSATTEAYGVMEWTEKYSEDGLEMCMKHHKSGATYKEFWCRKFNTTGWFKMVKQEGTEAFMKASKPPMDYDPDMQMSVHLEKEGDRYKMTECFGKHSITTRIRMDEEFTYGPGTPFEGKLLVTKINNRTVRFIYNTSRGEECWDMTFTTKGFEYTGLHKPSGASCRIWFEPFCNIYGSYKLVSSHNFLELGTAIGMPADFCTKIANEFSAKMDISDEGDGFVRSIYHSKYMPMDVTFKYNEQFQHCLPASAGGGKYNVLITKEGDTVHEIWESDKATVMTTLKFTGNWAIATDKILGTNIWSKLIMRRC